MPTRTAMLLLVHLADRQPRLLRDHFDEDMAWSPGQVQRVESFPDLDALTRIFHGRRLRFELAVALRCALFSCSQYFVTVIGSASRRRGHKLIRESRGIHRVFLAAGDEHYIARVPRLLGFRFAAYPGTPGYEAVATCLASPEVRARTAGVIAWRRQAS